MKRCGLTPLVAVKKLDYSSAVVMIHHIASLRLWQFETKFLNSNPVSALVGSAGGRTSEGLEVLVFEPFTVEAGKLEHDRPGSPKEGTPA